MMVFETSRIWGIRWPPLGDAITAIFLGNIAIGRYTCLNIDGAILTDLCMVTGDGTCGNLNSCLQSMC